MSGGGGRGSDGDFRNQYPANAPRITKIIALNSFEFIYSINKTSIKQSPLLSDHNKLFASCCQNNFCGPGNLFYERKDYLKDSNFVGF